MDSNFSLPKLHRRIASFAPGGINCPCCGVPPGPKRVKALRTAKRRERSLVKREIDQQLLEIEEEREIEFMEMLEASMWVDPWGEKENECANSYL